MKEKKVSNVIKGYCSKFEVEELIIITDEWRSMMKKINKYLASIGLEAKIVIEYNKEKMYDYFNKYHSFIEESERKLEITNVLLVAQMKGEC